MYLLVFMYVNGIGTTDLHILSRIYISVIGTHMMNRAYSESREGLEVVLFLMCRFTAPMHNYYNCEQF